MAATKFVCFSVGMKGVAWVRKDAIRAIVDRGNGATVIYEATPGEAREIETTMPADNIIEAIGHVVKAGEASVPLDPFR